MVKKELSIQMQLSTIVSMGGKYVAVLECPVGQVRILVDDQLEWFKKYDKRFTVTIEELA